MVVHCTGSYCITYSTYLKVHNLESNLQFFIYRPRQIIDAFGSHIDTDLQQRGVEFSALFRHYDGMRAALLEPMPPFEKESSSASQSSSMQVLSRKPRRNIGRNQTFFPIFREILVPSAKTKYIGLKMKPVQTISVNETKRKLRKSAENFRSTTSQIFFAS